MNESTTNYNIDSDKYIHNINVNGTVKDIGKVIQVTGHLIIGYIPGVSLGSICKVFPTKNASPFLVEVVGFNNQSTYMMPLGSMLGVGLGSRIELYKKTPSISVGNKLLGRVIDGFAKPMDELGALKTSSEASLYTEGYNPLMRPTIKEPLSLGVRAIDGFLTIGKGQRMGIMAGSGVGKSVLLGMMSRSSTADVNVIALIGERGREVREFIEESLGEEGLKKSVVIVATSDQSPLMRVRAAFLAMSVAEHFSGEGKDVLFMMDSVTRFAMAQREIGLSVGEPPTTKGYTPSCFALLPKLLERAGTFENKGSITGLYTVLVEGDDMDDPIADSVRSIVDGHIVLDRKLAYKNHYPAIDILQSTSRVMLKVTDKEHQAAASSLRDTISTYRDAEDLINIGAYKSGSNPKIDRAVVLNEHIEHFLKQSIEEKITYEDTLNLLNQMAQS
ncbi:MAG: FliI/YscN family ATPase [Bdellovibrionaceae bacterium]|jgi:flagellum-specific ATP synthase|nr:FliI/YscN family ATPase [Pseudobdellovibrionaceae bacterium]